MTSTGGFELRGVDGDETRILLHDELGYSIAIPGRPRVIASPAVDDGPRYGVVIKLEDAPLELGFRMDEVATDITAEDLVPALVASYGASRAPTGADLATAWIQGRALPDGAGAAMRATYPLRDDAASMEFLAVVIKRAESLIHALHMTVRYRKVETTPFGWSNLRTALLYHQSWAPGRLPSTRIWPDECVFARRSALFELTDEATAEAQRKAAEVGVLNADSVSKLAQTLIEWTNRNFPPSYAIPDDLEGMVARDVVQCVPSRAAEILLRDLPHVKSLHDFRGWLWECFWAVGNRAEVQKTN